MIGFNRQRLRAVLVLAAVCTGACASIMGVDEKPTLTNSGIEANGGANSSGASGSSGEGGSGACVGPDCACTVDGDCVSSPGLTKCVSGRCRACSITPTDSCTEGNYCSTETFDCTPGCKSDEECKALTILPFCVPSRHQCVGCREGHPEDCNAPQVCSPAGACVDPCNEAGACASGKTCCTGLCVDTKTDIFNCNGCKIQCAATVVNALTTCASGICDYSACKATFADCDTNHANGCECTLCGVLNAPCCANSPKCTQPNTRCSGNNVCRSCGGSGASCDDDNDCCSDDCESTGGSSRKCQ